MMTLISRLSWVRLDGRKVQREKKKKEKKTPYTFFLPSISLLAFTSYTGPSSSIHLSIQITLLLTYFPCFERTSPQTDLYNG